MSSNARTHDTFSTSLIDRVAAVAPKLRAWWDHEEQETPCLQLMGPASNPPPVPDTDDLDRYWFDVEDGLARAGDMLGPDFEYHLFTAATGVDLTRDEFETACERIFNLERAVQIRNFDRDRALDETVIPYFEYVEWWENPLVGEKKALEREKFIPLLERYYRLRGWDVETARPTRGKLIELGLSDVADELAAAGLITRDE